MLYLLECDRSVSGKVIRELMRDLTLKSIIFRDPRRFVEISRDKRGQRKNERKKRSFGSRSRDFSRDGHPDDFAPMKTTVRGRDKCKKRKKRGEGEKRIN